jgi:ABC-2 type transport system ATP-binding protein
MNAITLKAVIKEFRNHRVLSCLDLEIPTGQVVGLLGRNGSGKTTLMRLLMGLIEPTAGSVALLDLDVHAGRNLEVARHLVALVSEECHFYPWMTAGDLETFLAPLYSNWSHDSFVSLCLQLEIPTDQALSTFSKGTRHKLQLAAGLAQQPKVLLLDEPLSGLDAVVREEVIHTIIGELVEKGTTILVASHEIQDISPLCDRILMLHEGRLAIDLPRERLQSSVRKVIAQLEHPVDVLPAHPAIVRSSAQGTQLEMVVTDYTDELARQLLANFKCLDMRVEGISVKDIFVALTSRKEKIS